ncbi:MAG: hypothetical protein ABI625_00390 [bacterium]
MADSPKSVLAALALYGCAGASVARQLPQTSTPSVFAIDSALIRLGAVPLWPHFDPRTAPIAYFDGERTVLFRHPRPPVGFVAVAGDPTAAVKAGRDSSVTSNTSIMLDGVRTATVMLAPDRRSSADESASLAIHELFHVYERANHPAWTANEADLFTYAFDDAPALALRREETASLRAALGAQSDDGARCWSGAFLDERRARFARLGAAAAAYERGSELNEGLAQYVERRSIGRAPALPAQDYPSERVRERVYASGEAIGRLLDRVAPAWRDTLDATPGKSTIPLDSLLSNALVGRLGGSSRCQTAADDRASFMKSAESEVAALNARRRQARADFLAGPGPRVVVVAGSGPLFPQGFDPLNVQRLSDTEILHSRFLRLGNGDGTIEMLAHVALTTGKPGEHPLFAGVQRAMIAGLREMPAVRDSAGTLMVSGHGLTGRFRGAKADSAGSTITLRLP